MIYKSFKDKRLSMLGFGAMRLPTLPSGAIDEAEVARMTDYAMAQGVNYFDTAYPYHDGMSEIVLARCLAKYPRESYYLADKYPGHQISESYNPEEIFEEQLKKCGVDYFDFYLLHNVYENSIDVYLDERWGIVDYFVEQKRLGRIKHLGFSTHARVETIERFLDVTGDAMEFCQIQLNYLDRRLQGAEEKVKLLNSRNIPIIVMESLRGGKLCSLSEENTSKLKSFRPDASPAEWAFRYLQGIEGVRVALSGMSSFSQMRENIEIFNEERHLSENELDALYEVADSLIGGVPCTACRYCTDHCPQALDIPTLLSIYNDLCYDAKTNTAMGVDNLSPDKLPSACIACGICRRMCPQGIDIPAALAEMSRMLKKIPKWSDICREREEIAKRLKAGK